MSGQRRVTPRRCRGQTSRDRRTVAQKRMLIIIGYTPQLARENAPRSVRVVADVDATIKPGLLQTSSHVDSQLQPCVDHMFIQELLVHEARFEEELVRTQRHAPVLHAPYFEARLVVIRHRSEQAVAQRSDRSDTHAGVVATTGVWRRRVLP